MFLHAEEIEKAPVEGAFWNSSVIRFWNIHILFREPARREHVRLLECRSGESSRNILLSKNLVEFHR